MFSPTNLTNRRKFLERSALGAGSILFSSLLLQSCIKDHINPEPGSGLGDAPDIDWNAAAKKAVVFGVGFIPGAGEVIGALVEAYWPESNSPWDQMKNQVQELIDETIDQDTYITVSGDLEGLNDSTNIYLKELKIGSAATILSQFIATRTAFINAKPHFKALKSEILLLPLFAQFVNLYLTFLRDGAIHGDQWGMTPGDLDEYKQEIDSLIKEAQAWVKNWIPQGRDKAMARALKKASMVDKDQPADYLRVQPFADVNAYNRQMTLDVQDFSDMWEYQSLTNYPNGAKGADGNAIKISELLPREIYSDPYGTGITFVGTGTNVDFTPIPLPSPLGGAPTSFPTHLSIWSGDRIDAIQVTYPQGSGPNGITQTPRMGGSGGNENPIDNSDLTALLVKLKIRTNSLSHTPFNAILMQLEIVDDAGNVFKMGTANTPVDDSDWVGYPGEAISSIYVGGNYYAPGMPSNANCIVVGFKYWDKP